MSQLKEALARWLTLRRLPLMLQAAIGGGLALHSFAVQQDDRAASQDGHAPDALLAGVVALSPVPLKHAEIEFVESYSPAQQN